MGMRHSGVLLLLLLPLVLVPHLGGALGVAEALGCAKDETRCAGSDSWHQCSAWPQQLLPSRQHSW
jgi:hypothetical protein